MNISKRAMTEAQNKVQKDNVMIIYDKYVIFLF